MTALETALRAVVKTLGELERPFALACWAL